MELNRYKYLKTIRYKNISTWDIKSFFDRIFDSKYPIVSLGDYITEENKKYDISIPNEKYGILGVDNKIGIFDAYMEDGKNINQKYKKMETGWIAYNPYRVNVGSIGIKKNEHKYYYISPAYVVFSCKPQILNEYLFLLFKTSEFNKIVRKSTTGTVRQTLSYSVLKTLQIPLPSIEEQKRLIEEYGRKIEQSDKLAKEASDNEEKLEKYILEELGISRNKSFTECSENATDFLFLKFVRYKNIDKWSYDAIVDNNQKILKSDYFENRSLKTLLYINPNTSFSDLDDNDEISFVPMESVSDKYGELKEYKTCKKSSSKGYTKFKNGDLIWAKITPCMQNGKSTVVGSLSNGYGCGSTEFYVLRNENENLNIDYVHLLLRLPIVLKDAMKHFTGSAGQKRVPKTYLENLSIPYPPLYVQNNIVRSVKKQMEEIKQMRYESEKIKQEALIDFENEIFR